MFVIKYFPFRVILSVTSLNKNFIHFFVSHIHDLAIFSPQAAEVLAEEGISAEVSIWFSYLVQSFAFQCVLFIFWDFK